MGQQPDSAVINRLRLHDTVNSNAAAYREWNFSRPRLDLGVKEKEPDTVKAPVPQGMLLEQYRYPHLYELRKPGEKYVKLQVLRQLTFRHWIEAEADVCRFLPSYVFTIKEHPRPDANAQWWVVSVQHNGEQPGVLEHEAPSGRGLRYTSQVVAIPAMTRFVPVVQHAKRRVVGAQTAIVTGPDGEEIYPDKYGRVKLEDMELMIVDDPSTPNGPKHAILHVREDTGANDEKGKTKYKHYFLDSNRVKGHTNIDGNSTKKYHVLMTVNNKKCYAVAYKK